MEIRSGGEEEVSVYRRAVGMSKKDLSERDICSKFITPALAPARWDVQGQIAEQHRIVAKVDELMALCDQLETQLNTAQTKSRRLLEALLHRALAPAETMALETAA